MKNLIVFVCTGNICRSPMAEYLARHQLGDDTAWDIRSAGVATGAGMPASQQGVIVMDELGISTREHASQPLSRELVDDAALIVCMSQSHVNAIAGQFPDASGRVYLLKSFGTTGGHDDVDDPIGMPVDVYRDTRDEIDTAIRKMIPQLPEYTVG